MRQRVVSDTEDSSPFYQWVSTNGKGWRQKQQRKHNDLMDAPRDGFKGGTGKGIHFDGIFLVVIIWDYETLKQQLEGSSREWPAERRGRRCLACGNFYWSGMFQFVSCRTCQRHPVLKIRKRNSSLVACIAWTAHVVNYDMPLKYYDSVYYDVRIIWLANPASPAFDTQKIYWDARRLLSFRLFAPKSVRRTILRRLVRKCLGPHQPALTQTSNEKDVSRKLIMSNCDVGTIYKGLITILLQKRLTLN